MTFCGQLTDSFVDKREGGRERLSEREEEGRQIVWLGVKRDTKMSESRANWG